MPLVGWKKSTVIFVGVFIGIGFAVGGNLSDALSVPIMILSGFVGLIVAYSTPSHLSVWKALSHARSYLMQPKYIYEAGTATTGDDRNEGGVVSYTPLKPDTRTQDLTNVEMALSGSGAVLTDNDMVETMIEVDGDNMDFAENSEWASKQSLAADFADQNVKNGIKVHATTQQFQFDEIMERLERRIDDGLGEDIEQENGEVRSKRGARALLRDYYENRPEEIETRGTQEVRYFIVVSVSRSDILEQYGDEEAPVESASTLPVVGWLIRRVASTDSTSMSEQEIRQEMLQRLDERVNSVMNDLVIQTPGYDPERLTAAEIMIVLARLFNGNKAELNQVESTIETPTVVGSSRRDDSSDEWDDLGDVSLRAEGETQ
ncbi:hypothetical protein ACFQDD_00595 [Halorubrum pallidum]|uniref:TraC-like domain-containing protein n=1 Tax=Halorubrum pallidum TaxID=1526114 RepID=A0ABD5SYK3_9EURY